MPFKGELSNSTRAVQQRDRNATRDMETKAIDDAHAADRQAKYQLKKRIKKSARYQALGDVAQKALLTTEEEKLNESRFDSKKSGKLSHLFITSLYLLGIGEWMIAELGRVHKKWDEIYHKVALQQHETSLEKLSGSVENLFNILT